MSISICLSVFVSCLCVLSLSIVVNYDCQCMSINVHFCPLLLVSVCLVGCQYFCMADKIVLSYFLEVEVMWYPREPNMGQCIVYKHIRLPTNEMGFHFQGWALVWLNGPMVILLALGARGHRFESQSG